MIKYHTDLIQGSEEWRDARCGLLTASEMKLIVTPSFKTASNEKERSHLYELLAQRITRYVEPSYVGDDMLRGWQDEIDARNLYSEKYAPIQEVGFVTNDKWGFTIGCSPDGLVGEDGVVEFKSRRQKFQIETIINAPGDIIPIDYILQVQTALLVTERDWLDFGSFSGGLPMVMVRVLPDRQVQDAIVDAATRFEDRLADKMADYQDAIKAGLRLIPTKRRVETEMHL